MWSTNENNLVDNRGPVEPKIVGDCQACGGEMYDYEVTSCDLCENDRIHQGCIVLCEGCGVYGCKGCLKEIDGDWFCEECEKDNE